MNNSYELSAISYKPEARRSRSGFGWLAHRFSGGGANPSPLAPRPSSLLTRPSRIAFTLVEMVVVIGIILLLLALLIPSANSLVQRHRASNTLARMKTIEAAIQQYVQERPLGKSSIQARYFGNFPPHDYSLVGESFIPPNSNDVNGNGTWDVGETFDETYGNANGRYDPACLSCDIANVATGSPPGSPTNGGLQRRPSGATPDLGPLDQMYTNDPLPSQAANQKIWTKDYRSIEALYLYITMLSPQGKSILSQLPPSFVKNGDTCGGAACPDFLIVGRDKADPDKALPLTSSAAQTVELMEVYDDWGQPLRYMVRRANISTFEWELRSAGADGKFAAMFSPEDQSDDVVLRGQ